MQPKSAEWVADQVKWPAGYPRQREYPHPPPPSTNNSTTMINRVVISHLFSTSGQCSLVTKAECARTHGRNPKLPQVVTCKSCRAEAQQASRLTSAIHASTEVPPGTIRRVTLPERRYFVLIDPSARCTCCDDIW